MNNDLERLLLKLNPEIEKKCNEIKKRKVEKSCGMMFAFLLILFLTIPSILIWYNVNILIFVVSILIFILVISLISLPDFLKNDRKAIYYE